jgi:hypothetical protein
MCHLYCSTSNKVFLDRRRNRKCDFSSREEDLTETDPQMTQKLEKRNTSK